MKLNSRALERNVRRQARHEMRGSPVLWQDYRRHRTSWWKRRRSFQAISAVYLTALLFLGATRSGKPLAVLVAVALYASGTTLFRSANYYTRVLRGYDRAVLMTLPVLDDDYLRHESQNRLFSWSGALAAFVVAYGAYAVFIGKLWEDAGVVLLAAILQALTGLCLGSAILAYRPRWTNTLSMAPFYLLAFACIFLSEGGLRLLWSATLITPAGWVAHGFAGMVGASEASQRLWWIPVLLLSAALPFAFRRLRTRLASELASPDGMLDLVRFAESADDVDERLHTDVRQPRSLFLNDGQFARALQTGDWSNLGWIEGVVAASLTGRQKVVAEFMLGDDLGTWSRKWRTSSIITLVGAGLTLVAPSLPVWIFFLPMFFAATFAAPILGGVWPGFRGPLSYDGFIPAYACFPVSYGEISHVMLKTNIVRSLSWAPLSFAYSAALAARYGYSFEYGGVVGLLLVLLVMAIQPAAVVAHFASASNETRQLNWHIILFFGFVLLLLAALLVAIILMVWVPTPVTEGATIAVLFATSVSGWFAYGLLLKRGRIDLMGKPARR